MGKPARARRVRVVVGAVLAGLVSTLGTVALPAAADVTTVSVDTARTGWDSNQPGLSPSDVSAQDFGQLFATQLDGQIYAQPVVAKNTLLVLTENDKAYGLDPVSGAVRWSRTIGQPWAVAPLGCGDLVPNIGITSTPVVDTDSGTAWFTAKVDDPANPDHPRWELHSIDVTTGAEKSGFPTVISGYPDNDPTTPFAPRTQQQRAGLLLMNGVVYAGFGSHCDYKPFTGYVMGFDATTGKRTAMWATQTVGTNGGGVWQAGGGLVSDGPGRIIVATGNGVSPAPGPGSAPPSNLAESVVRLQVQPDGTLKPADFFSPVNNTNLDTDDTDLGSGGPMALPDQFGTPAHPHLLIQSGKDGRVFLLDRDDLGGTGQGAGGTDDALQVNGPYNGVWGHPGFWGGDGGYVYLVANAGPLSALKLGLTGSGDRVLTRTGTSAGSFGYTSGSPVVTSNGTTSGSALVWTVYSSGANGSGGQLRAYDPVPTQGVLNLRYAAPIGTVSKFSTPATDGGRVYVGNRSGVVYGFGRPTTSAMTGTPTDFGLVPVGGSSTQQVTVTAQKSLTVSKVATTAPFSAGAVTLPTTLAAGSSLTVPVSVTPTTAGAMSGAVSVTTSVGTFAFDLHGYATQPGLASNPPSLDFGDVPVGGVVTLSVNVSNTGPSATQVTGSSAPATPFSSSSLPTSGSTLGTGESVSVPVTFAPTTTGTQTSEVVVSSSTGTVRVPVTGNGVAGKPQLTLSPTQVDFGDVEIGKSLTKVVDISNTGNLLLTLTKAAPPAAPFQVPNPVAEGQQLQPGDAVHQQVTFAPTKPGLFTGSYFITGNDGRGTQRVDFTGYGIYKPKTGPITGLGGKCVDVRWAGTADGTPVQLYTCNGSRAQLWTVQGDGTIRSLNRCLDTAGAATAVGTKLQIMTCSGKPSQLWTYRPSSQVLVNNASKLCMDVPSARAVDKTQLQIYTCNYTAAQRWVVPT